MYVRKEGGRGGNEIAAVDLTDASERKDEALFCAGHGDVEEPPLLFFITVFFSIHVFVREKPFFHTAHEDGVELQALRRVDGHKRYSGFFTLVHLVLVACESGFSEKCGDAAMARHVVVSCGDRSKFFNIFKTFTVFFIPLVKEGAAHAAFLHDELHECRGRKRERGVRELFNNAFKQLHFREFSRAQLGTLACGELAERYAANPARRRRRRAEPVCLARRIHREPHPRERVLHLLAREEPRADELVRHTGAEQSLLQRTRLKICAIQNCNLFWSYST